MQLKLLFLSHFIIFVQLYVCVGFLPVRLIFVLWKHNESCWETEFHSLYVSAKSYTVYSLTDGL